MICGWYWFGTSGIALVGLWLLSRRQGSPFAKGEREKADWQLFLDEPVLSFTHVSGDRVVLVAKRLGRLEVYADELPPREWARLRRAVLNPDPRRQPATGLSTSN